MSRACLQSVTDFLLWWSGNNGFAAADGEPIFLTTKEVVTGLCQVDIHDHALDIRCDVTYTSVGAALKALHDAQETGDPHS